ncbi:hypothetical protein AGNV_125 [Anticarsia gemmatalis multiple nucleopolyhedrovirus]|uniref:Uncharacterized protein n=2 Tax=Alphabaculovirus TaxID=558016 RepID=A0A0S3J031_9ABAC|nr:hypothetical protein CFDNVgORF34 [Choristoneura fumiferana DEF multiple nucleopolyhedrovirus]YP_009316140.1 hypothetical protein AGNV_125 [Anticarsia gemmatalis multiple nucleopolyhedrovirus]YP_803432.1 hypothetical protein AGNV_125 [Anticarsia gemmatalis nucleopolyhedrovirus]AAQ91769.1 unknown [Choristoneura fumiferana DEF multiple nucleopolyhedrovirus]ABI13822.1 hypothetical protein AGNV_125 [Anticarsia gemmatalis multiple nucleopolyhedrovirus]ALR69930.1 hypothetical protein AGNV_125 [Ant
MFSQKNNDNGQSLTKQLDKINEHKRKIAVESQHFEKIYKLTKNTSELKNLEHRVMESRQNFLNFGVKHF